MNEQTARLLQENGVDKISFYFIDSPIINNAFTTCVLVNSEKQRIEARGVSICSLADIFSKNEGKNKAFGRAIKALKRKENNWKINGSGRDEEFILRGMKIKSSDDELRFRNEVAAELKRIDPQMPIQVVQNGNHKKYLFELPLSYPVRLANSLYKYKSQYRPTPVGEDEQELLKKLVVFSEPIEEEHVSKLGLQ